MKSFFINITKHLEQKITKVIQIILDDVLDAFNCHLIIEKLGELLKLMKKNYFNQYQVTWYVKSF